MERRSRRKFTAAFKTKVVLEALRERNSVEELARKYELHPNQITTWKKAFLDKASVVFEDPETKSEDEKQREADLDKLYSQIGQQKMEIDWLKKKLDL